MVWLVKRHFQPYLPTRLQHTAKLPYRANRIAHMFENSVADYSVEHPVTEQQIGNIIMVINFR